MGVHATKFVKVLLCIDEDNKRLLGSGVNAFEDPAKIVGKKNGSSNRILILFVLGAALLLRKVVLRIHMEGGSGSAPTVSVELSLLAIRVFLF